MVFHATSCILSPPCHPSVKGSAAVLIHSVREHYVGEMSVFSLVIVTQLDAFSVWATLKQFVDVCSSRLLIKKSSTRNCNRSNTTFYDCMMIYYKLWPCMTDDRWATYFLSFSHSIKCLLSAKELNGIVYPNVGARK